MTVLFLGSVSWQQKTGCLFTFSEPALLVLGSLTKRSQFKKMHSKPITYFLNHEKCTDSTCTSFINEYLLISFYLVSSRITRLQSTLTLSMLSIFDWSSIFFSFLSVPMITTAIHRNCWANEQRLLLSTSVLPDWS